MFKKLRNKLVLINFGVTTVVLVVAFSMIYFFSTRSADNRPPMPDNRIELFSDDVERIIQISIKNEKQAAAQDLLITLAVSGIAIELAVILVSYYLAEEAIKPVHEAYDAQKVFIANASHEIKTPLAAIAANLEAADIRDNKWISNVEREAEKLTALNTELLTLARTDLMTERKMEETDVAELVRENIKSFKPRMKNIDFKEKIISSQKVKIDRNDFAQILSILLDNAIKYSDKKVRVVLDGRELVVKNDGTTISKDALTHIFERFYQADKTADGVGLGLAIAKTAAERNKWELTVKSDNEETEFRLKY